MRRIFALSTAATLLSIFLLSMHPQVSTPATSNIQSFLDEIEKYPDIIPTISYRKEENNRVMLTIDFSHEGMIDKEEIEYLVDIGFSIYSYKPSDIDSIISHSLLSSDIEVFKQELKRFNGPCADVIRAYLKTNL